MILFAVFYTAPGPLEGKLDHIRAIRGWYVILLIIDWQFFLCTLTLTICRSTATRTQHTTSPPKPCNFWRGWPTALHPLKAGRQLQSASSVEDRAHTALVASTSAGCRRRGDQSRMSSTAAVQSGRHDCPVPSASCKPLSEISESLSMAICRWLPTSSTTSPACAFSISVSCDSSVVHSWWILHTFWSVHSYTAGWTTATSFAGFPVGQLTRSHSMS